MYKNIQDVYGRDRNLTIIQKVLGSSEGEAELMISNASTISSLSQEWINAVKGSGRFSDYEWEENQVVKMTTLNKLIEQYGTPSFIKIAPIFFSFITFSASKTVESTGTEIMSAPFSFNTSSAVFIRTP